MKSNFLKPVFKFILDFLSPFEILYLSVAVATLDHSIWSSAFLFEGTTQGDLVGLLIAVSVDLGMLFISRFLQTASSFGEIVVLTISFTLAAVSSFYLQLVYILVHTPIVTASSGVSAYWLDRLMPLVDARVLFMPLALPILATSYTIARIFHKRQLVKQQSPEITVKSAGNPIEDIHILIEIVSTAPLELPEHKKLIELPTASADLEKLTWFSEVTGKTHGPYQTRNRMIGSMKRISGNQKLLPATIEEINSD